MKKKKHPKCYDCNRLYGDKYGFPDLVIPNWAWRAISPKGHSGGLLCPSCICKRLYDAKIQNRPSAFTCGEPYWEGSPGSDQGVCPDCRRKADSKERIDQNQPKQF